MVTHIFSISAFFYICFYIYFVSFSFMVSSIDYHKNTICETINANQMKKRDKITMMYLLTEPNYIQLRGLASNKN